jgi:hypothetical protein
MLDKLPQELLFINEYDDERDFLHDADWLTTPFAENLWACKFNSEKAHDIVIDFKIRLNDGSFLTDPSNFSLLLSVKEYLCIQTCLYATNQRVISEISKYALIQRAIHIIDYFLLNSDYFALSQHGFNLVSENDIRAILHLIYSHKSIKASLYGVMPRIKNFFSEITITDLERETVTNKLPEIKFLSKEASIFDFCDERIIDIRIWLYLNGFIIYEHKTKLSYKYRINTRRLLSEIFDNRCLGNAKFDNLPLEEYCFGDIDRYSREYLPVPVQPGAEDNRASEEYITSYINTIKTMSIVNEFGQGLIDDNVLSVIKEKPDFYKIETKKRQRFNTLPLDVPLAAFQSAIIFFYDKGELVIDSVIWLLENEALDSVNDLPVTLKKRGFGAWQASNSTSNNDYFNNFRNCLYLKDNILILIGAIVIIINTLMARRVSELLRLKFSDIIMDQGDISEFFLSIVLSKANVGEHRSVVLRPLPNLCVKAINLLSSLHKVLIKHELLIDDFVFVNLALENGFFYVNKANDRFLNHCLDKFCDYIQTPLDDFGRRYYIRDHQLRRNFAIIFFWQYSSSKLEVLSYFLGHSKPSLTWRYITEQCPGKMLIQIKSDVALKKVINGDQEVQPIIKLIQERYNTRSLNLIPESDIADYILSMQESGQLLIEPEFFETPSGETCIITYKIIYQK